MKIRLLESKDQEQVQDIMSEHPIQFPRFIIEKYPKRWTNFMEPSDETTISRFYVAIDDTDKIIGHAGYLNNDEVGLFEIVGVAVKKDLQRQGIGKALINTICNDVKDLGKSEVILYTLGHLKNEATLSFYRNIGFDMVNCEIDFFRTDYHRVTFVRKLSH